MNDHHVYDWIDEAGIPKGTKIETSRWCDDIKPGDGPSRHATTESAEDVACVGHEQRSTSSKGVVESGTSAWRSFIVRFMSSRWCDHRLVCW